MKTGFTMLIRLVQVAALLGLLFTQVVYAAPDSVNGAGHSTADTAPQATPIRVAAITPARVARFGMNNSVG